MPLQAADDSRKARPTHLPQRVQFGPQALQFL
jgi:hypothetical protein